MTLRARGRICSMSAGRERGDFIRKHAKEIATIVDDATAEALTTGEDLSGEQEEQIAEKFETKVFTWERPEAAPDSKSILLEAAEPAAYNTVHPLIKRLQRDTRCGKIVLVTDNIAGKRFEEERNDFSFEQIREPSQPVMADIPGGIDIVLALIEPSNSPEKVLLYAGKSVYGDSATKNYLFVDGFLGGTTRKLLTDASALRMDPIDGIFVSNDSAKRLLESAVPECKGRAIVAGSLMLESLKQTLPDISAAKEKRLTLRDELAIPQDAVAILYSGFPSVDYEELAGRPMTGNAQKHALTLNQETFKKTLFAVCAAAERNQEKKYALIVRTHPRAQGEDSHFEIPENLPENLRVVRANAPAYGYDDLVNAVTDIVACQSTSTEVFLAPYRGVAVAVFNYAGVQERINERVFGSDGAAALKRTEGLFFASSESALSEYVAHFQERPERKPLPDDSISPIIDELFGEGRHR